MALVTDSLISLRPLALHNLAFVHRAQKRYEQEIALFCEAASAYQEAGDQTGVRTCRFELAWHHLCRGNAESAWPHLTAVLESDAPMGPDGELHLQVAIAWHQFLTGQLAESEAACLAILDQQGVSPRVRADVEWLLGRHALCLDDAQRATKWAALASRHAAEAWLPAQMERAALLQREIAQYQSA
jgi:tetratricopeptide (TPR) repeat protein